MVKTRRRKIRYNPNYWDYQEDVAEGHPDKKYIIVKKGRRVGITTGMSKSYIKTGLQQRPLVEKGLLSTVSPLLWVDTIHANIDRYFERMFLPVLSKLPKKLWHWSAQKKQLTLNGTFIDFRSADRPENIEGFGYRKIFLNEAGIILKNNYLYENAILPMLLDYPDSQLIAAGTPKGKRHKGEDHKFWQLWKKVMAKSPQYWGITLPTSVRLHTNPAITQAELDDMRSNMSRLAAKQELNGEFVEYASNLWVQSMYSEDVRKKILTKGLGFDPTLPIYLSFDFNKAPVTCLATQCPKSKLYYGNAIRHFKEFREERISIDKLCRIIDNYFASPIRNPKGIPRIYYITGDASGHSSDDPLHGVFVNHYQTIQRVLKVGSGMFKVPKRNPRLHASRQQVDNIFENHPDILIDEQNCPFLIDDLLTVQANEKGEIDKKKDAAKAHLIDCIRYYYSTFEPKYLQHL